MPQNPQSEIRNLQLVSRRDMLLSAGLGFGGLALAHLLPEALAAAELAPGSRLLAPGKPRPHYPPRAKSVIFLFMEGGPSHLDTFDPKPDLEKYAGKPLPPTFKPVVLAMGENDAPIMPSKRQWKQHGEGGLWISDWLPHTTQCADDLCVIRSCWTNGLNHSGGVCQMNTGTPIAGRPSLGAWVSYGLGTENENLPAFVVMEDTPGSVVNGPRNWSAGFMPAQYQGTALLPGDEPIRNLASPQGISTDEQRRKLDLLARLNRRHAAERAGQSELEARIASYELAFRMQAEAPEAVDLRDETAETIALYGLDQKETQTYGRMCLLARRLVERGVRFIQLYSGAGSKWDAHSGLEKNHSEHCLETDKPIAGLLMDLKRRGLLNDTLVIWGGEFGRTPMSEKGDGRDHNPYGFSMWVAGAGIRGGRTVGTTDEIGLHAVEDRLHVHDLHATFLHLLGVDHMKLVYMNKGRPERATINEGEPSAQVIG
ncbi:MAG TPA: DUF1501 domain-containing protein [Pirellulaceae bacterium]|nr:DUF1501 domain-containing protein [Pirellulaceae bacterium]